MATTISYKTLSLSTKSLLITLLLALFAYCLHSLYVYFQAKTISDSVAEMVTQLSPPVRERVGQLDLPQEQLKKLIAELIAIETASRTLPDCEQYALIATQPKLYPIVQSTALGDDVCGWIFLNVGETWRFGQTCCCEDVRYPGKVYFISRDGKVRLNENDLLDFLRKY